MKRLGFIGILLLVGVSGCKEASAWIRKWGFVPINPPTTLLQPGAMIAKKRFDNSGTRLVCSAADSLGPDFVPANSKTITGKFSRKKGVGWHVGADVLSEIHVNSQSSAVSDVYIEVTKAQVITLTDADVLRAVANRSQACQAALARRKKAGADISIIASALVADCKYKVTFERDSNLDAQVKIDQVHQVALALGGNVTSVTEDDAQAEGLVWGITDSKFLAAIGMEDADVQSLADLKKSHRQSILSPNDVLSPAADSHTLTPIITPMSEEKQAYEIEEAPLWCPTAVESKDEEAVPPLPAKVHEEPEVKQRKGARSPPNLRG